MTIEVGDLIKIIDPSNYYYNSPPFTVTLIDNDVRGRIIYRCLRGGMVHPRFFFENVIEKVESKPRFEKGTLVYYPYDKIGIIETSNRLGSMVRQWRDHIQEHRTKYMSNGKLRRIK